MEQTGRVTLRVRPLVEVANRAGLNLLGHVQYVARLSDDFSGVVAVDSLRRFVPCDDPPLEILDDDAALGRTLEDGIEELACLGELVAGATKFRVHTVRFGGRVGGDSHSS
jgi:hypothetical protein